MRKFFVLLSFSIFLFGCNSIYVKPGTMEPGAKVFAVRGGYSMKRSVKQKLEEKGFAVVVGRGISSGSGDTSSGDGEYDYDRSSIPSDAKYMVRVYERKEWLRPIWCAFNGFWWWNFNVSIADQKTGEEILAWRGRGCAKSSVRKLDGILEKLTTNN
jgi:hypothetical protein